MKKAIVGILVLVLLMLGAQFCLAMQSDNYSINWDSLNSGGLDNSSSDNYRALDTLGQAVSGFSNSDNYNSVAGYRQTDDEDFIPFIGFNLLAEDINSEVSATVFNNSANTVVVSQSSGFLVDDYLAVVENKGASQKVAVGKISVIDGNTITVDGWQGDNSSMQTIDGDDDYAYKMSNNFIDFGVMLASQVKTGISFFEVTTNAVGGYTVQVVEDKNFSLESGDAYISDVVDGAVDGNAEEYGLQSIGTDAQGSGDWAITSSLQDFALNTGEVVANRTIAVYKVATDALTAAGQYQHTVTYYATANF